MNIDQRIKQLPHKYIDIVNKLQKADLVQCLHLVIDAGEEYCTVIKQLQNFQENQEHYEKLDVLNQQLNKYQSLSIEQESKMEKLITQNQQLNNEVQLMQSQYDPQVDTLKVQNQQLTNENINLINKLQQFKNQLISDQENQQYQQKQQSNQIMQLQQEKLIIDQQLLQIQKEKQKLQFLVDDQSIQVLKINQQNQSMQSELEQFKKESSLLRSKEIADQDDKHSQTETEQQQTKKQENVLFDFQVAYGQIQKQLDNNEKEHLIQLLFNQNYSLSNLLYQQYISGNSIIDQIQQQLNEQNNKNVIKKIYTMLVNFKDFFIEQQYVQKYVAQLQQLPDNINKQQIQEIRQLQQNLQTANQKYLKQQNQVKQLQVQLKIQNQIEVNEKDLLNNKYTLSSVYYKCLCQYYQNIINSGIKSYIDYNQISSQSNNKKIAKQNNKLLDNYQQLFVIVKQINQSKYSYNKQLISESDKGTKLPKQDNNNLKCQFFKEQLNLYIELTNQLLLQTQSENNTENINQIIIDQQSLIQELQEELIEQEDKITQLQEINSQLQHSQQNYLVQLQDKFDTILVNTDTQKLQKLQDIVIKQQQLIISQQQDLEKLNQSIINHDSETQTDSNIYLDYDIIQQQCSLLQQNNQSLILKYDNDVGLLQAELVKQTDLKNNYYNQLKIIEQNVIQFTQDNCQSQQQVEQKLQQINQLNKGLQNINIYCNTAQQVMLKQQEIISKQKKVINIQLNKKLLEKQIQTDQSSFNITSKQTQSTSENEERGIQVVYNESIDNQHKDTQTEVIECERCKHLVQTYIVNQQQILLLKKDNQALQEKQQDYEQVCQKVEILKRQVLNLHQFKNQQTKQLIKIRTSCKKRQHLLELEHTQKQEIVKDNEALTNGILQIKKELKQCQIKIKELTTIEQNVKQQLVEVKKINLQLKKDCENYNTIRLQNKEYKTAMQQSQSLTDEMKKQLLDQNQIIQKFKKQTKIPSKAEKDVITSILTEEDIQAIYTD